MITEKERITEWLSRVVAQVDTIKSTSTTKEQKLKLIQENYQVLAVLTKVASRHAYMVGVPLINQIFNK